MFEHPSVCVGVITGDFIRAKTVMTLIQLLKTSPHIANLMVEQGPYIHLNRNRIVEAVLKDDYTHLFFVDNDVCFAAEALDRLIADDKDIVAAPYNKRCLPPESMIKMRDKDGNPIGGNLKDLPKELFKCYALGTGCMLIKTEVFKNIEKPWFYYGEVKGEEIGEDVYFCKKAHEAGYDVWCNPSIQVGHVGEHIF